jgi:hypothetical protein
MPVRVKKTRQTKEANRSRFFVLGMISAQTPLAFVASENRIPLFGIMPR